MEYYSLTEYVVSIIIASIACFIGIAAIGRMAFIEKRKTKFYISSVVFGAVIYFSYLNSNFSDIHVELNPLIGLGIFIFTTYAVNVAINVICMREVSFLKILLGSVFFASCISLINIVDVLSEVFLNNLQINLLLFISANILLVGTTISTIRFFRQLREVKKVSIYWPIIGSFAIGMGFASVRFTIFSSITLNSNVDLFTNQSIVISEWIYFNDTLLPLMINIGSLVFLELVPGLFSDFNSQKQKEQIIENKNLYETLYDNQAIAIFSLTSQGKINRINQTVVEMSGFKLEELQLMSSFNDLIAPADQQEFAHYLQKVNEGHSQMFESKLICKDKDSINVQITLIPIFVKGNLKNINVLAKDITEVIRTREEIHYLAYHDTLTKLPNRRYFSEEFNRQMALNYTKMAVVFLDLDRFKLINDVLGHSTGDRLLTILSNRFLSFIKDEDIQVARMGGDEFLFLFTNFSLIADLEHKIEDLFQEIQKPFLIDNQELYITGSLGVAIYPDDSQDGESLLKFADEAMYRAKDKGKNTYEFYHNQSNDNYTKRLVLERDLRKAIIEQQFEVYYQPIASVTSKTMLNVEALVRWNHPEEGLIGPSEFISMAEESGIIHELGEWVLYQSFMQVKEWQEKTNLNIRLSVNVSFKQFYKHNFVSTVKSIIEETGYNPKLLDLEITESMAMKDIEYAKIIFEQLRNIGISISIDDFGTGYSSLNHLKNFPIDRLKIDGSIVRDVPTNSKASVILKTIVTMAKNLGLETVAEHVETGVQFNYLKTIECNEIQGYYYSRPLKALEMHEFLHKQLNVNV